LAPVVNRDKRFLRFPEPAFISSLAILIQHKTPLILQGIWADFAQNSICTAAGLSLAELAFCIFQEKRLANEEIAGRMPAEVKNQGYITETSGI